MRLVAPHVGRAALIANMVGEKARQADDLADALDGLDAAMFLLDADRRIVHANAAAHRMLARNEMLRACSGRLSAIDPAGDQRLHRSIDPAGHEQAFAESGAAVPLTARCGTRYVARVLPLDTGERRGRHRGKAAVALFVHKAALQTPWLPELLARHYRLTPAELRVLLGIVEVGGVPEVAQLLGIAETTVKTHLGRLFEKTGASRQAELVKIVAGYSTPILG
jgi:DNA-binding CsgD family transcriptional regulator